VVLHDLACYGFLREQSTKRWELPCGNLLLGTIGTNGTQQIVKTIPNHGSILNQTDTIKRMFDVFTSCESFRKASRGYTATDTTRELVARPPWITPENRSGHLTVAADLEREEREFFLLRDQVIVLFDCNP